MQRVKLYTADGGFVVAGQLPPFLAGREAQVVLWGARVFQLSGERRPAGEPTVLLYTEVFAVALVSTEVAS